MSIKPQSGVSILLHKSPYSLLAFESWFAPLVLSWVRDDKELFWIAPKTPPPLTVEKIIDWPNKGSQPMILFHHNEELPLGYCELNALPSSRRQLWLGHCIIRPDRRGQGLGRHMVEMTLEMAFHRQRAKQVSLVVFPENEAAVTCYQAAGFRHAGHQRRNFPTVELAQLMLYMTIDAKQYTAHVQGA